MGNDNYELIAKEILENVGKEENIEATRHCVSRIRFKLKNEELANTDVLKELDGIKDVVSSGGEYQIIVGTDASEVYNSLIDISDIQPGASPWKY